MNARGNYVKKTAVFLLVCSMGLLGMAGKPGDVPAPEINFKTTIIDDQDITTKCTNSSMEGETFLKGERGSGLVAIPFEKIKKMTRAGERRGRKVDFQVLLKSGETIAITMDEDTRFYGTTSFGTYRIFAKNIKEVVFE